MNKQNTKPIGFRRETKQTLAAGGGQKSYADLIAPKTVARTRKDIQSWNRALKMTRLQENPKWYLLQQLFDEISLDARLQSQYKNRILKVLSQKPVLRKPSGEIDEKQTDKLNKSIWAKDISRYILDSNYRAFSVIEFSKDPVKELSVELIPRENINIRDGLLYPDYNEDKGIPYREVSEYGRWILEFYEKGNKGLFNNAVPHVLFKRFAQSCWSELCEINGIPPRVLKTDTQDPAMLQRGQKMMRDMGSAAWFIIDENESFEWAASAKQDGNVYQNLIDLCNNEISLLFSGAIIGQDTKNGNRSKEESSQNMLQTLIDNDLNLLEKYWNTKVIPALREIGVLSGDLTFEYEQAEDIDQLYEMTKGLLQSGKDVDDEWINEKFGVKVTGNKNDGGAALNLKDRGSDPFI